MKPKRAAAALLAALLLLTCCLPVLASEPTQWKGEDYTFTVPSAFIYAFGPDTSGDDPTWGLAGVTSGQNQVQENEEYGVVVDLYSEGGAMNIKVMSRSNETTQEIFDLREMAEEDKQSFLDSLLTVQVDEISVERRFVDIHGQPFYYLRTDGSSETYGDAHEIIYGTLFNGHTLNFDIHASTELDPTLVSLLEELVQSVEITQRLTREEAAQAADTPLSPQQYAPMLIVVGLLLCMVLAPLIYVPVRRRLDKKNKARMTALLTEHERRYHGKPWEVGSLLYANATDCTRETLHTFSLFHAYVKQIRSVVLGTVLCVLILVTAFVFRLEWWIKLASVAVTVYFAYRVISAPGTTERIQRKEYSRGLSSTAQYMFYEDGFRVSGVQPMSVYPYFKILSVRRWDRYIYLYTDADNAWILDKNGFSVGEADAFVAFIRAKVASFQEKGKGPGKQ